MAQRKGMQCRKWLAKNTVNRASNKEHRITKVVKNTRVEEVPQNDVSQMVATPEPRAPTPAKGTP
jgi:hypothetical protein